MTKIVFVGGVHGVGKSYFCRKVINECDVDHVSASSLISLHIECSEDKVVSDVEKNQSILAEELSRYKTKSRTILLDGHFCLLKPNQDIEDVSLRTFKEISPQAIVLLKDVPESIVLRLSKRDNLFHSVDLINKLQAREIERALFVSQSLNIPFEEINPIYNIEKSISRIVGYL